ncbi:aminoacyl-histidine dipeptidase [Thaumasiovibrio subtropicus]|uniref:aminoacyl-histidine dipeptidase n=1 Tax=Thaumasiovibrio subtropicus TaxID=1891207 RepID=UPI000B34FCC9|nr:aminoacyl-histidine dipeptidase [Thaumasiovibrio subtropicus]
MSEISQLTPQIIWHYFDKICSIPHPSYHEEQLAHYIVEQAKEKGLEVRRDKVGNIIIKKAATAGMENRRGVVLQAHLDMVPQKNEGTDHDFTQDPIQAYVDGDWVTAKGTTLGADNGMGMAACLAVAFSDDIEHGPLEVLLTMNEEAGMDGAFGLEAGWLEGDVLLNTDSEQEGEIYMGCAGGIDAELSFVHETESAPADQAFLTLTVKGLKGGHSGCDIHTGRANANKLLAHFLFENGPALDIKLIDFKGGTLRNAIPREAKVTMALPQANVEQLHHLVKQYESTWQETLGKVETSLVCLLEEVEATEQVWTPALQQRFIAALHACPNGVIRMSDDIQGVVETSLNVGVISVEEGKVNILCLVRSLIDAGREHVESLLKATAQLSDAEISFSGAYPGWKPNPDSEIMALFRETYEGIYGRLPNIMVIHAGLECGLFKKPYPDMDMISFGPTIKFPHSPDEKVEIASVGLFWEQMIAILKAIPVKQ